MIVGNGSSRGWIDVKESVNNSASQQGFRDNVRDIFYGDLLVKNLLGQDDYHRSALTETMAARAHNIRSPLETLFSNLLDEG
jgi:hypothetical protein